MKFGFDSFRFRTVQGNGIFKKLSASLFKAPRQGKKHYMRLLYSGLGQEIKAMNLRPRALAGEEDQAHCRDSRGAVRHRQKGFLQFEIPDPFSNALPNQDAAPVPLSF